MKKRHSKTAKARRRTATGGSLERVVRVRLVELLKTMEGHPWVRKCGVCKEEVGRTALVDLVYTWEACGCDFVPYSHLVEHIYHKRCFTAHPNG
jgi:hypothetical protein